jgi:hypothetical protein
MLRLTAKVLRGHSSARQGKVGYKMRLKGSLANYQHATSDGAWKGQLTRGLQDSGGCSSRSKTSFSSRVLKLAFDKYLY